MKVNRALSLSLVVCSSLMLARVAVGNELTYSTQEQIYADAVQGPCSDQDRLEAITALFKRAGASEADIRIVEFKKGKNVIVTLPGSAEGYIVIGAHYDKSDLGCGAIDNWTGVVILSHVYRTSRQIRPQRTVLFVGFGREEAGLEGSMAMAGSIPKAERSSYCAMVNLDSFGLAIPQILSNVSTISLEKFTRTVADKAKVPISSAPVAIAAADSLSFKKKGIPAVTLHGLSAKWQDILHTASDQPDRIQAASVYLGYVLSLNLLARLDNCDCSAFR
ncbi:MAG: M28 family peptidase [Acidobacteriota bacterium]